MTPAIFFLHGFPNNGRLWENQTRHLEHLGEGIAIEWGSRSPGPWVESTISDLVGRVARLRAAEPRRPVYLVAHDLGCFLASEAARLHPELFAGQILINGVGVEQYSRRWKQVSQWLRSSYVPFLLTLPAIARGRLGRRIGQLFYTLGGVGRRSRIRRPEYNDVRAVGVYRELVARALRAFFRRNEPNPVPTLFIAGRRDPFLATPTSGEVRRSFSRSSTVVIDGGHWLPVSEARAINELIENFLLGVRV